ncbi:MAG: hypothetical protein JJU36_17425 [Phycisphaeraceae bacterium]|nr:hypothetical protein [Phycisphaeraceae bacterium]
MPKLTLSADKDVIEKAKQLAKERGTSVSAMFSQFVENMASADQGPAPRDRLGPITRKAMGLVKLPPDKSYRELIEEAIIERYKR